MNLIEERKTQNENDFEDIFTYDHDEDNWIDGDERKCTVMIDSVKNVVKELQRERDIYLLL